MAKSLLGASASYSSWEEWLDLLFAESYWIRLTNSSKITTLYTKDCLNSFVVGEPTVATARKLVVVMSDLELYFLPGG